ncbi:MAG: ParB/RepB/Spo0J family partition protein [Pseudonocardiaceae bacterium]|nr:ParB/RepB/Spo0J family partition protein [Pseudonocardiaceae bacterium]
MSTTVSARRQPAVANVPLERLRAHPDNVRRDLGDLRELTDSIRRQGLLQPLRVEQRPCAQFLRIRAGHRRAAAAQLAGLTKVACVIVAEAETDEAITEMFAENLHRAGLTVAEKRDNARRLIHEFGYTVEGVATAIRVAPTTVAGWLRQAPTLAPSVRPDGRKQMPGRRNAWFPTIKPTAVHELIARWRCQADRGLDADQARALLDELDGLLQGWAPLAASSSTTVNDRVLAAVAELDGQRRRPVREVADRIGCHPKLVERARAALRRAS